MISNIWQYSKNFYRSKRWLYNWLFSRLSLFQKYCKLIGIDLTKQQKQDADPEAIKQINFTGKRRVLDFSKRTVKVLKFLFHFNITLV